MSATAVDIQGAQLLIEAHRAAGHHQDPKCRACGLSWPCPPRIAAVEVIRSVLAGAFRSVAVGPLVGVQETTVEIGRR